MWLEIHKPELNEESASTTASFRTGNEVGTVARRIYDPKAKGITIDARTEEYSQALDRSRELLETAAPVFEAGFAADGGIAFADIMLPVGRKGQGAWRMVEVKSSTSVKDYHRDDAAIQAFISRAAGVPLAAIALAHIDNTWVYPGNGDYEGLLVEEDLTEEAFARGPEVRDWLEKAHGVADRKSEPRIGTGGHCSDPFECGFADYCRSKEPQPHHSPEVLPRISKKIRTYIEENSATELHQIPDELLNPLQLRVKQHTLSGKVFFNAKGAAAALADHPPPALFLDFETISLAVPIWKGTRPYQQIAFQFSLHRLTKSGALEHVSYLNLDGNDPSRGFVDRLIDACKGTGPIFVYNIQFERTRLGELAGRFPAAKKALTGIMQRLVDLLPIARDHYYHPDQEGSWSIKAVLPALIPELSYDSLDEVKDGGLAMTAFAEAIQQTTTPERRQQIERSLVEYCKLDTYAMVRIWQRFAGRNDLKL